MLEVEKINFAETYNGNEEIKIITTETDMGDIIVKGKTLYMEQVAIEIAKQY